MDVIAEAKKSYKKHVIVGSIIVLAIGVGTVYVPWRIFAEHQLQSMLRKKGFDNARLSIQGLGLHEARVKDISIGSDIPLGIKDLTLKYTLRDLWNGNLDNIDLAGLSIELRQLNGKWHIQGYAPPDKTSGQPSVLPVTNESIARFPLDLLTVKDSQLNVVTDKWHATLPLNISWTKIPQAQVSLSTNNAEYLASSVNVQAAAIDAQAVFDTTHSAWQGQWTMKDVLVWPSLPLMQGAGTLKIDAKNAYFSGQISSPDKIYAAKFNATIPVVAGGQTVVVVEQATMNWKGGKILVRNVRVPVSSSKPVKFTVQIDKISVDEVLQAITGKRVSATGFISGAVPVTWVPDGQLSFGQGKLQSTEQGVITMPEEALPGDNPQLQLTRDILKNFHYQDLTLGVKNETGGGIGLSLALNGKNPDVFEGRPVKLNVNLSGDILDFAKQNAMLMNSPETLLKQDGQ